MFGFRRECNYCASIYVLFLSEEGLIACECTTLTQKVLNE